MKKIAFAAATAVVLLASPALAEKIDLGTMKCSDFVKSDEGTMTVILSWIDGFYKDPDASAVIDTDLFVENSKKLGEYCGANPDIGVGTAAEELFGA
jgi:acid stress chaperone HdeB